MVNLAGCGGPGAGPEEELRQWISESQELFEARERRALMKRVSTAFGNARGHDRDNIEGKLRAYFFRQKKVELVTSIDELRIIGDSAAEIELTAGFAGTNDSALGFSASAYRFKLELQKEDGDWMLLSARWGRLGEELQ